VTPIATDKPDQAANDEFLPETPEFIEQKKDELTDRLSTLASQTMDATDNAGLQNVARDVLIYGFALCSEMLPQELETLLEELRAANLG
jgi:hypothetical protein